MLRVFVPFLSKLGFVTFILIASALTIFLSEFLIMLQSYWLTGNFFTEELLIVGLLTSTIASALIFSVIAYLIKYLHNLEEEKERLLVGVHEKSELLKNVINQNPDIVLVKDSKGKFLLVNEACATMHNTTVEAMIGKSNEDFNPKKEQTDSFKKNIQEIIKTGKTQTVYEDSLNIKTGELRHFKSIKKPYVNNKGETEILVVAHDITEDIQTEEELKFLSYALDKMREANFLIDEDGKILRVNEAACKNLGYTKEELSSMTIFDIDKNMSKERWKRDFKRVKYMENYAIEARHQRKDGTFYSNEISINFVEYQGKMYHLSFVRDTTEKKEQQQKLEYMAHFDSLTQLPNRTLLVDRIEQAMYQSNRKEEKICIVYIDLDEFKNVNDLYGHNAGDAFLNILSKRMHSLLREGDTIARLSGDEFVVLLVNVGDAKEVNSFLKSLLELILLPVQIDTHNINVSASIGVTFYPQLEHISSDQLIRQADQAMYEAKIQGKNRFIVFDDLKDNSLRQHNEELFRIEQALKQDEFELYYQPKVNMRSGEIIGFEALIRWNHPEKGLLAPIAFLPYVEEKKASIDIDLWVLKQALTQLQIWQKEGLEYTISVNIGAQILQRADFMSLLREVLQEYDDLEQPRLVFEILETSTLEDLNHIHNIIVECKKLGINFSLDDFGTGYSSLTYLKHLPVAEIKIDQSFVLDMLDNADDLSIVDGVIGFAHAFRKRVIAEGVERYEHGSMLLELGCELAQGYIIAKPMPISSLMQWCKEYKTPTEWIL